MRSAAAALFTGLFTLQLVLAGSVAACATWDHGTHEASASETAASDHEAASTTRDMHGMTTTEMNGATQTDEAPCNHPLSPEQCLTMAPCATGFLPAASTAEASAAPVIETIVAALVAMPRSVSFPPERRPPRA